jgi:hypothetical protein
MAIAYQVVGATLSVNAGQKQSIGTEGMVRILIRTDDPDMYLGATYISSSGQGFAMLPGREYEITGWQPDIAVWNDGANPARVTFLAHPRD